MEYKLVAKHADQDDAISAQPQQNGTEGSIFADSAIDMDATTTSPTSDQMSNNEHRQAQSLSPISQTLADRLRRAAAATWALEQDDEMPESKRGQIQHQLENIEAIIGDEDLTDMDEINFLSNHLRLARSQPVSEEIRYQQDYEEGWIEESDLSEIHNSLSEAVVSMRLRQEEQRHLHQLTATKLEAIAQKCLFQEQQMQNLLKEMRQLRAENQMLGQENDRLRDTIGELESEASKREVAVNAMASAVAGLEGWIDDTDKSRVERPVETTPVQGKRPRRAVIRGKGRFRGRYYVDEEDDPYFTGSEDARELQDGVRAWIRGFRDVEDACSSPMPDRVKAFYGESNGVGEDEWGEFERPTSNA